MMRDGGPDSSRWRAFVELAGNPLVFGNQEFEARRRGLESREKGEMTMESIDGNRWRIGRKEAWCTVQ
jgi:hypothetical protein